MKFNALRIFVPALVVLTVFQNLPVRADEIQSICSDRPGLGTSTCTVDQGHWQVELGLFDASLQHRGGVTTDFTTVVDPTIKYGLSGSVDLEASIALNEGIRIHDALSRVTENSVGDVFLNAKWNPHPGGEAAFRWILDPFIKLPTASHELGNGKLEAGLLVPMSYEFDDGWSLDSTPEADMLANETDNAYHFALVDVIGIGRNLSENLSLCAELWTSQDFGPDGTISQYSLGPALAWLSDANTQFDGGFAVGLNRQTPDLEFYAGISRRF